MNKTIHEERELAAKITLEKLWSKFDFNYVFSAEIEHEKKKWEE